MFCSMNAAFAFVLHMFNTCIASRCRSACLMKMSEAKCGKKPKHVLGLSYRGFVPWCVGVLSLPITHV